MLGKIFLWNVTLGDDFDGLEEESHNFLLVCHHWFEVASCTPELWSFWGNTLEDWARWHHRSGTAPLDLVLGVDSDSHPFDVTLRNVLRDRATRDTIRRIHLKSKYSTLLNSIISSLTASSKEPRPSSVESFMLRFDHDSYSPVDISDFFAHHRFPKLQRVVLYNCGISSWDLITLHAPVLTTLDLDFNYVESAPSLSQLLSILSYPTLRKVSLVRGWKVPGDCERDPTPQVSLRHLKELKLGGDPRQVFELLHRLDNLGHVDNLEIALDPDVSEDFSHIIGPYLRDYLRHRSKPRSGLGLSLSSGSCIELHIGDVGGIDFFAPVSARMDAFMAITIDYWIKPPKDLLDQSIRNLITHVPREEIVHLRVHGKPLAVEDLSTQLPNLRGVHFEGTPLPAAFPTPNLGTGGEIFPSLQYVLLDWVVVDKGDWGPLKTFLDHRVSSGNQLHTLVIAGSYHISPSVWQSLKKVVKAFR